MWQKLLEEEDVDWGNISNKPLEFPPKQHLHEEYAESSFVFQEAEYDLHDVVTQIIVFLEDKYAFKLK